MIYGKNITVTGTTRGIGKAITDTLSPNNAVTELNRPNIDLENIETLRKLDFKDTDVLILNAGHHLGNRTLFENHSEDHWLRIISCNLTGNLFLIQKYLQQRETGTIVIINSTRATRITDDLTVYSGVKAALDRIAINLRYELYKQKKDIRVLDVKPSLTRAELIPDPNYIKVSTYTQVAEGIAAALAHEKIEEVKF